MLKFREELIKKYTVICISSHTVLLYIQPHAIIDSSHRCFVWLKSLNCFTLSKLPLLSFKRQNKTNQKYRAKKNKMSK